MRWARTSWRTANISTTRETHRIEVQWIQGIGSEKAAAPQARLMATVISGILSRQLPWGLVMLGVFLVIAVELLGIRSLSFAVGAYLSIATTLAIFCGGVVRWMVDRAVAQYSGRMAETESEISPGSLYASGLIAAGGIVGLLGVALKAYENFFDKSDLLLLPATNPLHHDWVSVLMFALLAFSLYYFARKPLADPIGTHTEPRRSEDKRITRSLYRFCPPGAWLDGFFCRMLEIASQGEAVMHSIIVSLAVTILLAVSHRNRSVAQKAIRVERAAIALPPTSPIICFAAGYSQPPRPSKIFIPQVQPTAPARKSSGGAPCLVQEDNFFYCDSHPFNNRRSAEPHAERDLRNFLRNATAKTRARFAASSPLRSCPALLSLGNVVEESTTQLSPFLTDNLS